MRSEDAAKLWAERGGMPTTWEEDIALIALDYGEHKAECALLVKGDKYAMLNDCTCGWGATRTHLNQALRKLGAPKGARAYPIGGGEPVSWEVAEREQDAIEMQAARERERD